MFDFIKTTFKKGDKLKLSCVSGEFSGEIVFITSDSIIIKTFEGKTCGIKGSDISFFEEIEAQEKEMVTSQKNEIVEPKQENIEQIEESNNLVQQDEIVNPTQNISLDNNTQNQPINNNVDEPNNGKPKLKILGKIDLDAINSSSRPAKAPKIKSKPTKTLKGLESLSILVEDEHKAQNEKYLPALGEIEKVWPYRNFGFIKDGKTGKQLYFSFNQIVDSSIVQSSAVMFHMPVVYSIQGAERGDTAITIHRPNKVIDLLKLSQSLIKTGEFKHAIRILEHILDEYPDNFDADNLMRQLEKTHPQPKTKTYSNLYNQAKKYNLEKNYPKAIEFFRKAIEAGEKLETSIKDLGMLYAQLYKQGGDNADEYKKAAICLIEEHRKDLPNVISTLYYLENLYYSIQDYNTFINIAQELLDKNEVIKDKNRSAQLLCKIAAAYIRLGENDKALDSIDEALSYDPTSVGALKLKAAIESENQEEITEVISATQFDSLTSGLSPFIQQTLDEYNEYAGIKEKIIDSENFKKRTLSSIRHLIETTVGRSKDRAKYILTEVKLMQDIEPDEIKLRSELARYCNDMAKSAMFDQRSLDVVRFYYYESFSLEDRIEMTLRQVVLFLSSFYSTQRELLNSRTNTIEKDELEKEFDSAIALSITKPIFWNELFNVLIVNTEITSYFSKKLFSNPSYKKETIKYLHSINVEVVGSDWDQFAKALENARDSHKNIYNRLIAYIKSWGDCSNLDECLSNLIEVEFDETLKKCLCALDGKRFGILKVNIIPALKSYVNSTGYRNKEVNRNNANGQIQRLIEEIKENPTKISYEGFLPFLELVVNLLDKSFNEVLKMSEPQVDIHLLSEQTVINDSGVVNIQIEVTNHKDSSPVKEVSISIDERDDIKLINAGEVLYNAIEGGESHIFKLQLEVGENIINQKATALTIYCIYINGGEQKQTSNQISLKLYSADEFTPISNPYAPIADGGPVPLDSKMFFGRETEITNIVESIIKSPSKQIIIYGQKRSGKSSVMLHLKKSLLDTGKTFCVFFSLGDIINNLNEAAFYYKIIRTIKDELEFLEMEGVPSIPTFDIPSAKEFKMEDEDNPLNTFTKYMVKFKLSCKHTNGWEDKNLVVMIDEFTYLYTEIKKGNISSSIMKQWKAITQNERAQFSVVLVGQDVVPSFKKEDYARNAFGVIQDIRLTYLKDEPAKALIETPILDKDGQSRYIGNAISRIIEYTSRNPYYIQIFCSRLVDFMNNNKSISVTEADVNEVARSFVEGSDALEEDKFDNLIRAGESEDLQEFPESEILAVLRQIALGSKNVGYCNRRDINVFEDKDREDAIINDLYNREVIEINGNNNYKIQVKLFQEWLLKH